MAKHWFAPEDFPSKAAEAAMLAAFDKPDAKAPASMGAVGATVVMLTAIAARIEKCVNAVAEDQERQLSELRAKAAKVDDLEGRIKTFDPLVYTGREMRETVDHHEPRRWP